MMAEHEIIVVGRDVGGGWTVRESSGPLLGRFPQPINLPSTSNTAGSTAPSPYQTAFRPCR